MDLNLLRSLVAVADAGAITEAANRLGVTQPALTRRIQQLEQEFGAELLSRSRKGAELTELGRLVEREARLLIDRYDALKQEVASHSSVAGGYRADWRRGHRGFIRAAGCHCQLPA